jgi:hypothetical protein
MMQVFLPTFIEFTLHLDRSAMLGHVKFGIIDHSFQLNGVAELA